MEPKTRKAFSLQDKMNILAQMDDNEETRCADCQIWNCAIKMITTVRNRKDTEEC
jgi:hypothetical protein